MFKFSLKGWFSKAVLYTKKVFSTKNKIMRTLAQFPHGLFRHSCFMLLAIFMLSAFLGCRSTYDIKQRKTGKFEIGESWPPVDAFFWKGMEVVDTLFNEDGYSWGVQILRDEKGQVVIEENFFLKGKINRIRIEHPKWKGNKGMALGQRFGEVKENFAKGQATYLVDYEVLDIVEKEGSGIHYLLKVENPELWKEKEQIELEAVPDSLVIYSIVIM